MTYDAHGSDSQHYESQVSADFQISEQGSSDLHTAAHTHPELRANLYAELVDWGPYDS